MLSLLAPKEAAGQEEASRAQWLDAQVGLHIKAIGNLRVSCFVKPVATQGGARKR